MNEALGQLEALIAPQVHEKGLRYDYQCCDPTLHGTRGPGTPAADPAEPALERREVHAARRRDLRDLRRDAHGDDGTRARLPASAFRPTSSSRSSSRSCSSIAVSPRPTPAPASVWPSAATSRARWVGTSSRKAPSTRDRRSSCPYHALHAPDRRASRWRDRGCGTLLARRTSSGARGFLSSSEVNTPPDGQDR